MSACAVALGGCFTITSLYSFYGFRLGFRVTGLVGESVSLLSLVSEGDHRDGEGGREGER